MTQKQKYITKSVQFGNKQLTLYSLDGCTWSTRKDELQTILERHEAQKVTAAHLRGEVVEGEAGAPNGAAKPVAPQALPKRKLPVGGYRKEPLQLPHPAYAMDAAKKKDGKPAAKPQEAAASIDKKATPQKSQSTKKASAAPKAREGSRPAAKKGAARKRAVA